MTSTQPTMDDDLPTSAERRARRTQREAVERACSQLAASGELTAERQQAVATLAARLRRRLVDDPLAVARESDAHTDAGEIDPTTVVALFSE
ncbi:hypothetical protein [Haloarchaeobius salinus]|uniref:hypothetical protein n=1 Tax=Haloarchaeobius salinus TaxID=1198298 RepID=UPI0021092E1A|nr:hypothetical protein [Haloarchaeobius salinus]